MSDCAAEVGLIDLLNLGFPDSGRSLTSLTTVALNEEERLALKKLLYSSIGYRAMGFTRRTDQISRRSRRRQNMNDSDLECIASDQHELWCNRLLSQGINSRPSPQGDGEDLISPWSQLSSWAKDYNIKGLMDTLAAIRMAGYTVVSRADLARAGTAVETARNAVEKMVGAAEGTVEEKKS